MNLSHLPDLDAISAPCFYALRPPVQHHGASADESISWGTSQSVREGIADGFVIAPFNSTPFTIPVSDDALPSALPRAPKQPAPDFPYRTITRAEHEQRVARAVAYLREHGGKVVLSRTLVVEPPRSLTRTFRALCEAYPTAFVFCYRTPRTGCWIGASPELLLEASPKRIFTMALAGTRPAGTTGAWDNKNIEEQRIVAEFISDTLRQHGMTPSLGTPTTRAAGPAEHICTEIQALPPLKLDIAALLSDLSPTPALGGYPKQEALAQIAALEDFPRGCYGGYIGLSSGEQKHFMVNLRSMLVRPDHAVLFVGGGITPNSVPATEWEETCLKASTLTSLLS